MPCLLPFAPRGPASCARWAFLAVCKCLWGFALVFVVHANIFACLTKAAAQEGLIPSPVPCSPRPTAPAPCLPSHATLFISQRPSFTPTACRYEACWRAVMAEADGVMLVYNPDAPAQDQQLSDWFDFFVRKNGLKDEQCMVFAHRNVNATERFRARKPIPLCCAVVAVRCWVCCWVCCLSPVGGGRCARVVGSVCWLCSHWLQRRWSDPVLALCWLAFGAVVCCCASA